MPAPIAKDITAEIAAAIAELEEVKQVHKRTLQQLLDEMSRSRSKDEMVALELDLRTNTEAHLNSEVFQKREAALALVALKELDERLANLYGQRAEAESRAEMATGARGAYLREDIKTVQAMKVAIYMLFKEWHQETVLAYRSEAAFSAAAAMKLRNPLAVEEMPPLPGDCLLVKTAHPLLQGIPESAPLEARRHALLSKIKGVSDVPPNEHWSPLHDILVQARWAEYVAALTVPEAAVMAATASAAAAATGVETPCDAQSASCDGADEWQPMPSASTWRTPVAKW
jgi:hypothetical protein